MVYRETREALVAAGLLEMLRGGYDSVGIARVLSKTGVPKGSFYHYFDSKEAFGCAIIETYGEKWRAIRRNTFERAELSPLERLDAHFRELEEDVKAQDGLGGCLLGNLSQLVALRSEPLRRAVETAFAEWQEDLVDVLEAAQRAGELPPLPIPRTSRRSSSRPTKVRFCARRRRPPSPRSTVFAERA